MAPHKGRSSVRCWPTSTSIRSTTRWPGRAGRWCATPMTSSSCAKAENKPNEHWKRCANERGGFDFLGYHFERGLRWPRHKSLDKLKEAIRQKTQRGRPDSMGPIVVEVNRTLRGWMEYFK